MKFLKIAFISFAALTSLAVSTRSASAVDVTFEKDKSLPVVYINVVLKTGAVSDPRDALGLTNFMGEMLLRGTNQKSKEQIDLAIDQMGAVLGVETRSEAMIIRGAVLSSQLGNFLSLVQELITQSNFPEVEIGKLKSEVESEILEDLGSDQKLVGLKFTEFLFGDHPYGKPILGKLKTVRKFDRAMALAQYRRLVGSDLLLVLGSGDADTSQIQDWADGLGKVLPQTHTTDLVEATTPENPTTKRLLLIDKPARTQTQITGGQVGVQMLDPDFFPLYLGNHAFGGESFSARLMVEIRVKRGWSYGAYSYFKQSRKPRSWQFYLFPAAKDTPAALAYTLNMVDDLQKKGVTQEEFSFAQQSLVNSAGFMYNTPRKRVENKLMEKTLGLPDGFMKTYGPKLQAVSLTQVNAALHNFIKPEKLSIVVLGTAKDLKAPLAKAAKMPESAIQVVPYNKE
jgi:zinc protease